MIDKKKLLQWIDDEIFIYSTGPYDDDTPEEIAMYKARTHTLRKLEMQISAGILDVEEVAHERSTASSVPPAS